MPPPDRMLATLRRAAAHVRATPGRTGHLVQLQACTEVLAAGDLHGHIANFQAVLKAADLANHPGRHLVLQEVIHSEFFYPNGGDKSHQLVDLFAALKCQFPARVHLLPGNHEMAQMTGRTIAKGAASQNSLFVDGVRHAYGEAAADVCQAYYDLFRGSPLALRTANGVFLCHTLVPAKQLPAFDPMRLLDDGYEEKEYQPGGLVYGILWGRDTAADTADAFLRKVDADLLVTGHIPTDAGYLVPNPRQLILDCAATPAAYALFPADRPITLDELLAGVVVF
jgi:hypothetical protein